MSRPESQPNGNGNGNGAVAGTFEEDTGRHNLNTVMSAAIAGTMDDLDLQTPTGGSNIVDQMAEVLAELIHQKKPGGGDGGVPPEKHAKSIKRHNWAAIILALILGPGGALTVVYATSDRSKANSIKLEQVEKIEPRVEKVEDSVELIQVDVSRMGSKVDSVEATQKVIVDGIEELKQENVESLKDKNARLERELWLEKRRRRR